MATLNLFPLKEIPQKVYLYKIEYLVELEKEKISTIKRIANFLGIYYNAQEKIGYSLLSPEEISQLERELKDKFKTLYKKISIKFQENAISLEELDIEEQEQVVQLYIKIKFRKELEVLQDKIYEKRKEKLKELEEVNKILREKGFYLSKKNILKWDVAKVDNKFYFIVDFKHSFRSNWYLSRFLNSKNLVEDIAKDLAGKKKIFENISGYLFVVDSTNLTEEEVKEKILKIASEEEVRNLIEYHNQNYPEKSEQIGELEKKFNNILYKQPLIKGQIIEKGTWSIPKKKDEANLLPMFLREVFVAEDNPDVANLIEHLDKFWKIDLKERLTIIKEAIKEAKLSFLESYEPLTLSEIKLDPKVVVVDILKDGFRKSLGIDVVASVVDFFFWTIGKSEKIYKFYDVPRYIRDINKVPLLIIIDKHAWENKEINEKIRNLINNLIKRYNKLRKVNSPLPYFEFDENFIVEFELTKESIPKILQKVKELLKKYEDYKFALAWIFGKQLSKSKDYYHELERSLLKLNIIPQNFLIENVKRYSDSLPYIHNSLLNILAKIGIKPFSVELPKDSKYDYILGLDVGVDKLGGNRIAGVTIVFDSNGIIRKIKMFDIPIKGESLEEEEAWLEFTTNLINSLDIDSNKKYNILILRDGKFYPKERRAFKKITENFSSIRITIINVVKRHSIFVADRKSNIAINLGNKFLLLPHKVESRKRSMQRPIKVEKKFIYEDGKEIEEKLTVEDVNLIYSLTRLNYSTLFSEEKFNLKTPAPIHYADKYVKALKEGKRIENKDLEEIGALYFI